MVLDTNTQKAPITALASAPLFLILAINAAAQLPTPVATVPNTEEVYRNIHFFKGVPYDQFVPTMYLFSESLGVECDYCHEANRELDGKPTKQIAGKMFQMVERLNRESFGGSRTITCYTCHRGGPKPVDMLMLRVHERNEPDSVSKNRRMYSGALPTVTEVLDKFLAALGGAASLQKISIRVERGTVSQNRPNGPPTRLPVEAISERPGKRITKGFSVTHLGNSPDAYGVYVGEYGWVREGSGPVRVMWNSRLDAAKLEDTLNFTSHISELVSDLNIQPPEDVGGNEAYVLSGRTHALPLVKLYFDRDTGLLVRLVYHTDSAVAPVPTQIDYADFRTVDGVHVPFRWTVSLVRGVNLTYQLDEVRHNVAIDESVFAKPTPPPPLY